ncbi:CheR family methyltransferase [Alteribacter populi]|uniref:CheR family methyltransferase n=1 Tax=Alteribacter populi TaxID=2011011 RepID=UPI000BBA7138|nr:protein-glutamate O-methyltransferase CheR [Alteribacter populi]
MNVDYLDFKKQIKQKAGIDLSLYKEAQMKRRLTSLREKRGYDTFSDYGMAMNKEPDLFEEFLDRMTINVSEFYRNPERWNILKSKILPRLLTSRRSLKIWSAACSTGEEPYTLAMLLNEIKSDERVKIEATDLDETILKRARAGFYPERSLKDMPREWKSQYFSREILGYRIDDTIKRTVSFRKHDLLNEPFNSGYDLIMCRNVLIYFTEEAKRNLYTKFANALNPGGVLFVGSTEQIFNPKAHGFETEDTFFYRKIKS